MNVRVVSNGCPDTAALAVVGGIVLAALARIDATHSNKPNAASEGGVFVGNQAIKEPYAHHSTCQM